MRRLSYIVLATLLLVVAAKSDSSEVEGVKTKGGPKIRRTIRVHESSGPEAATPGSVPAPGVVVSNSGPSNSVEVTPNISINEKPNEQKTKELPQMTKSNDVFEEEPKRQVEPQLLPIVLADRPATAAIEQAPRNFDSKEQMLTGSNNKEQTLIDGSNNSRNIVQRNSGNSESVIIDGVGNTKTTKISMAGQPEHEHTATCGCKDNHHLHRPPVVHHHHYGSQPQVAPQVDDQKAPGINIKSEGQTGSPLFQININGERSVASEQVEVEQPRLEVPKVELPPQLWANLLANNQLVPYGSDGMGLPRGFPFQQVRGPSAAQVQPIVMMMPMMNPMMQMMPMMVPMIPPMAGYPMDYPPRWPCRHNSHHKRRDHPESRDHSDRMDNREPSRPEKRRRRRRPVDPEKAKPERRRRPSDDLLEPQVKPEEKKNPERLTEKVDLDQIKMPTGVERQVPELKIPDEIRRVQKSAGDFIPWLPPKQPEDKEHLYEIGWVPVPTRKESELAHRKSKSAGDFIPEEIRRVQKDAGDFIPWLPSKQPEDKKPSI